MKTFPHNKTDQEWQEVLTSEEFKVMRQHGTERAFSHEFAKKNDTGIYTCKGCGEKLFLSDHKYDSGTGWPSFFQPIDEKSIETQKDFSIGWPRTEVHCSNCGSHLGHVFKDGPNPTGQRYCINSVSLGFEKNNQ